METTDQEVVMVTYRKGLERNPWHRPWPIRVVLVPAGLVLILAGAVGWNLEEEYGGDPDRQEYVIGHDDETGQAVVNAEEGELMFESVADAETFVESQRGSRNYTVPILLFIGAALLIITGVSPSLLKREPSPPTPTKLEARS